VALTIDPYAILVVDAIDAYAKGLLTLAAHGGLEGHIRKNFPHLAIPRCQ